MKAVLWQLFPCQPELEGSTQQVPRLRGEVMRDTPCPLAHAPCPGRPSACVHTPQSWEGTGPGAWCQLRPGSQKGTRCPLPLQGVLWELLQDPNRQALSVGPEGALK